MGLAREVGEAEDEFLVADAAKSNGGDAHPGWAGDVEDDAGTKVGMTDGLALAEFVLDPAG